jgi:hypothetical protein
MKPINRLLDKLQSRLLLNRARKKFRSSLGLENSVLVARQKICAFPNALYFPKLLFDKGYILGKIFYVIDIKARQFNPWEKFDVILSWQDVTNDTLDIGKYIQNSYSHTKKQLPRQMINFALRDISKDTVGRANKEIFGYELDINPQTYRGKGVLKSKFNATHDGLVLDFPISKDAIREDKVYSVLINNELDGFVFDHRLIFMRGILSFFYLKKRPVETRFSNTNSFVSLEKTQAAFSAYELEKINAFCYMLGADYAEIDVLRDHSTQKIYIVDVSRTPAGPPNGLSVHKKLEVVTKLSEEFARRFLLK